MDNKSRLPLSIDIEISTFAHADLTLRLALRFVALLVHGSYELSDAFLRQSCECLYQQDLSKAYIRLQSCNQHMAVESD